MSPIMPTVRPLLVGLGLLVASWSTVAHAEQEFPGALAEAADMECVPTCLMCHTVNPGTANTWTSKPLGIALGGPLAATKGSGDVDAFNKAWSDYTKRAATEPSVAAAIALIKQGIEPGANQDVCGPKYGCGATFAHTPSRGLPGSSAAVVAALSLAAGLWVARRRR
jgi:hypothetical protein